MSLTNSFLTFELLSFLLPQSRLLGFFQAHLKGDLFVKLAAFLCTPSCHLPPSSATTALCTPLSYRGSNYFCMCLFPQIKHGGFKSRFPLFVSYVAHSTPEEREIYPQFLSGHVLSLKAMADLTCQSIDELIKFLPHNGLFKCIHRKIQMSLRNFKVSLVAFAERYLIREEHIVQLVFFFQFTLSRAAILTSF